jgi:hypothetical protein
MHINKADEILFHDLPEEIIVIEFVNTNKKIAHFIKDKLRKGFFNYSHHTNRLLIGDLVKVRLTNKSKEGYFKLLTLKPDDGSYKSPAIKSFNGVLRINTGNSFGFVDDIFINNVIINQAKFTNHQTIQGKAILSFNKNKNDWGWKAYTAEPVEKSNF